MRRGERGTGNRFSTHVLELHRPAREFVFLQHTCSIVTVPGSAGEPAPASQSQRHHLQRDPVPLQLTRALGGRPAHRHNRWQKDPPLSASWTRYAGGRKGAPYFSAFSTRYAGGWKRALHSLASSRARATKSGSPCSARDRSGRPRAAISGAGHRRPSWALSGCPLSGRHHQFEQCQPCSRCQLRAQYTALSMAYPRVSTPVAATALATTRAAAARVPSRTAVTPTSTAPATRHKLQ